MHLVDLEISREKDEFLKSKFPNLVLNGGSNCLIEMYHCHRFGSHYVLQSGYRG